MSGSRKLSKKPNRLRVGFDGTPLFRPMDGVGRYTQSLISSYARNHNETDIIIVGFFDDPELKTDLLKLKNISVYKIPLPRKLYQGVFSRLWRPPIDIFLPKLDVYIGTNFIQFPRVTSIPTIAAIHDVIYLRYPETVEVKNLRYLRKNVPKTLKESSLTVATSDFTREEITHYFPGLGPVPVVANGVDKDLFSTQTNTCKKYILTVGTIEPRKNLHSLIEAFSIFRDKHPEYKLLVVGRGGWGNVEPPQRPSVEYLGYVDDHKLKKLYAEASLFAFPSVYEGFGLPILEAFASATPVACSDIKPFRDIAGDSATYFKPSDVNSIKNTLETALSRPLDKKITAEILDRYSWDSSAEILHKVILNLLK